MKLNTLVKFKSQAGFTPVVLLVVVLGAIGLGIIGYQRFFKSRNNPSTQVAMVNKQPPKPMKRSKSPEYIKYIATAKAIDPKTGKEVNPAKEFSLKDKIVYLVLDLNNPNPGSKVEYVRYMNGRYVDHKSMEISEKNLGYVNFDWTIKKSDARFKPGKYRVKTYTNGIFEKNLYYTINQNLAMTITGVDDNPN